VERAYGIRSAARQFAFRLAADGGAGRALKKARAGAAH
jgi:hypothetical protein